MAEEEMSFVHTLAIVLNARRDSDIYQQIYNKDNLVKKIKPDPEPKNVEELQEKGRRSTFSRKSSTRTTQNSFKD